MVYPVHPICWDIFLQNHALLAKEKASKPNLDTLGQLLASQNLEQGDGRGLRPNWTDDYLGPEQFWADGWLYHEEPEASEVAGVLDYTTEWDFLVYDPQISSLGELLVNPPLLSNEQSSYVAQSTSNSKKDFSHLPAEILLNILCFLPTASVHALRFASRAFASLYLNTTYWRSRFDYPNEFCHVRLPPSRLDGQPENSEIDWRTFCDRLVHINKSQKGWQNRERILLLTSKLVQKFLLKDPVTLVRN